MSNLSIFNFESHTVRSTLVDGEPWFVAADVCRALTIADASMAVARLDDEEKGTSSIGTLGGTQEMTTINESGLYSLTLTSRKEEAKRFKKWLTSEVLPSIRKTGKYETTKQHPTTTTTLPIAEEAVRVASAISDCLHLEGSGRLAMLEKCIALKAPSYLPALPAYAIDAPRTTDGKLISSGEGSSLTCAPVSDLLKKFSVTFSPASFNKLLLSKGFLEVLERKSTSQPGAVRSYKAVSAKGLAYGKNLVNPKAQGETQPYWFHNTFPQLLKELNVQL